MKCGTLRFSSLILLSKPDDDVEQVKSSLCSLIAPPPSSSSSSCLLLRLRLKQLVFLSLSQSCCQARVNHTATARQTGRRYDTHSLTHTAKYSSSFSDIVFNNCPVNLSQFMSWIFKKSIKTCSFDVEKSIDLLKILF